MSQMGLFTQKKFWPIFWTQFFGAFNDNLLKNALVIMVTFQSVTVFGLPSSQIVALAGGIFILPFFLFSAISGQIADKFEKSKITRWVKVFEVAIMILAAVGLLAKMFELLLFCLFLAGLQSTIFGPIKYSILPQHLNREEIVGGNALVEAGTFLAILLGTIAGGVLIQGESGPIVVSAALLTISVIGYATSVFVPKAEAVDPGLKLEFEPFGPTWKIFGFAKRTRSVYLSILGISWFWFFGAALLSLFAPLCRDVFNSNENLVTVFLATFSLGTALGSLLCEKLSRQHLELGLVPLGSIGLTISAIALSFHTSSYVQTSEVIKSLDFISSQTGFLILLDLFFLSVFGGFFIVPMYTLMQERSEPQYRSRIIAANNILSALFMVVSSVLLAAMFHFEVPISTAILILGILNAVVAIYIYTLLPEFLLRFLVWGLTRFLYRVRTSGHENIPKQGAAILIANHLSFVDWMVIAAGIKRPVRFVMDHSYFRGFLIKRILVRAKVIPIAPAKENPELLEKAYAQMAAELRDGEIVCIFPEGKVTYDGKMNPFKPGILKMLAETPVSVVPMGIHGLWGSRFSRQKRAERKLEPRTFWPLVTLRVGAVISPDAVTLERLEKVVEELRQPV
jgi:1-acyl-sn-glycerol-3-phosphate acyltransferase